MSQRNAKDQTQPTTGDVAQIRERMEGYRYDAEREDQWVEDELESIGQPHNDALRDKLVALIADASRKEDAITTPELGRTLTQARLQAGLTRLDVAKAMGSPYFLLERLEEGRIRQPSWDHLERYAEAVGCRLEVTLKAEEVPRAKS